MDPCLQKNIHLLDRSSYTRPSSSSKSLDTTPPPPAPEVSNNQLHMTENQMTALFNSNPNLNPIATVISPENSVTKGSGFGFPLISRMVGPIETRMSGFTVVDSNDTLITSGSMTTVGPIGTSLLAADVTDSTTVSVVPGDRYNEESSEEVTSSPSSSSETDTTIGAVCRKRKIEETDEPFAATTTTPIEDVEKKHSRGSSPTKRTRAADVHNLSQRRRRDRINEKMKALQELVPRSNKSDKAVLLDEAIEYVKSLQTEIQMMSMGYGMMYAGMQQQYAPLMGTGMGMGMGMSRPVMHTPYPPAIPGPAAAVPSPGTNVMLPLALRLPISSYALPCVQPSTAADSIGNQYAVQIPEMTQIASMANPSRPYLSYQQMQMQRPSVNQPVLSKPSARKSEGDDEEDIQ